ncbi:MAG TPA: hypothetical protein VEA44_00050 [Caulobacter sp.]|nr:hypothetical protein [Caulobacter sp.]
MAARRRLRILLVLAVSAGAHVVLLGLMATAVDPPRRSKALAPLDMSLLPFSRPGPRAGKPDQGPPARSTTTPGRHRDPDVAAARAKGPVIVLPDNPDGAGEPVREAPLGPRLPRQLGCSEAAFLRLTRDERDRCALRMAGDLDGAPTLAVVNPARKAIFDGDCPRRDDWCRYRTGAGPYPGLFALMGK